MIDRDQVLHVARLARLRLTDEELERMPGELSKILEHVEKMDELGIERSLMFPTLASLIEERLSDDPVAIHVLIHSLNQWLDEVWGFNYQNRIFTTPVITLPIVEKAIAG